MTETSPYSTPQGMLSPLIRLLSRAPLVLLYALADVLFAVLYYLLRFQRTLVVDNIATAFPDRPPREVQRLAARSYRNALHVLFETVYARTISKARLAQRVVIENPQLLDEILKSHANVIVASAHQGNWEWLQLACSAQLHAPLAALYKPVNNPGIDALLNGMRSRFGTRLIAARTALPDLLAFARTGGVIALVADQGPRPEEDKYWSRFMGRDTAFFPGLEKIARLLHAPVVFAAMQRTARGRYRICFSRLTTPPYSEEEGAIMEPYIRQLEQQIRQAPEAWLWVYKRWKYQRSIYE